MKITNELQHSECQPSANDILNFHCYTTIFSRHFQTEGDFTSYYEKYLNEKRNLRMRTLNHTTLGSEIAVGYKNKIPKSTHNASKIKNVTKEFKISNDMLRRFLINRNLHLYAELDLEI